MQGLRVLSFFPTKKNPAPAGDDDRQMIPAARDSARYFSIASLPRGRDSEKMRPRGGGGSRLELYGLTFYSIFFCDAYI